MGRQVASDDDIANRTELLVQGYTLCKNCNGLRHLYGSILCLSCEGTGRHFNCPRCKDTGYDPEKHIDTTYGPDPEPVECIDCRDRDDENYRLKHRLP